jgi:hypothetical protein
MDHFKMQIYICVPSRDNDSVIVELMAPNIRMSRIPGPGTTNAIK